MAWNPLGERSSFAQSYRTIAGKGYTSCGGYVSSGNGGLATEACITQPSRVKVDSQGNIYFREADIGSSIRKIDGATGIISEIVDGASTFTLDNNGTVYYAYDYKIYKIINGTSVLVAGSSVCPTHETICGDGGLAINAKFKYIRAISISPKNGEIFISDTSLNRIRKINAQGIITTVAGDSNTSDQGFSGDGGLATQARLSSPGDTVVDSNGHLYINDNGNNRIRKVDYNTQIISTVWGTGEGTPRPSDILPLGTGEYATEVKLGGNLQYLSADSQGTRFGFLVHNMEENIIGLAAGLDYVVLKDEKIIRVGAEVEYNKLFAARAGYEKGDNSNGGFSFGAGVSIEKFTVDYAFTSYSQVKESVHKIGLSYKL